MTLMADCAALIGFAALKCVKTLKMVEEILKLAAQCPRYFQMYGVGEGDLQRIKAVTPANLR